MLTQSHMQSISGCLTRDRCSFVSFVRQGLYLHSPIGIWNLLFLKKENSKVLLIKRNLICYLTWLCWPSDWGLQEFMKHPCVWYISNESYQHTEILIRTWNRKRTNEDGINCCIPCCHGLKIGHRSKLVPSFKNWPSELTYGRVWFGSSEACPSRIGTVVKRVWNPTFSPFLLHCLNSYSFLLHFPNFGSLPHFWNVSFETKLFPLFPTFGYFFSQSSPFPTLLISSPLNQIFMLPKGSSIISFPFFEIKIPISSFLKKVEEGFLYFLR